MQKAELFEQARKRASLPEEYISLDYRKETDLLAIRFSNKKRAYSRADMPEGIIYDYDSKDNLVQVEILDFYIVVPVQNDKEPATSITVEAEIKKAGRAARRKNRRSKIVRHCCKLCGQRKHYICLQHNQQIKPPIFKMILNKLRRYAKKFYFGVAGRFGLEG
jgi:hypothetical protein